MNLKVAYSCKIVDGERCVDLRTSGTGRQSTVVNIKTRNKEEAPTSYASIQALVERKAIETGTPFSEETHDIYHVTLDVKLYTAPGLKGRV